jgi:squalene cyclase
VRFLSHEVPRWRRENGCFSCHNNGDGARALFAARAAGYEVPEEALSDTLAWLSRPGTWDDNKGDPGFSDKRLARIQFSSSLFEAAAAGLVEDSQALDEAARNLLGDQSADGSWPIDAGEQVGSPVTYGAPLATYFALRTLAAADAGSFSVPIRDARRQLLSLTPHSVPDLAAVLLCLLDEPLSEEQNQRLELADRLSKGQKLDGGWGPYQFSPSEVFDTALALLVLSRFPELSPDQRAAIQKGREYLKQTQLESGGWIETTRPSGADSYAQHISTSAWATQALIATRQWN